MTTPPKPPGPPEPLGHPFDPASRAGGPTIEVASTWGDPRAQAARLGYVRTGGASGGSGGHGDGGADTQRYAATLREAARGGGHFTSYRDEVLRARDESPHYLPPEVLRRLDALGPRIASSGRAVTGELERFFQGLMPQGANFDPGAGRNFAAARQHRTADGVSTGTGYPGTFMSAQKPYLPEFEDPARQNYPVHRALANTHWRMFYRLDPTIGMGVDLKSRLTFGNFKLVGEGVQGSIKTTYETCIEETQLIPKLPFLGSEFQVVGEVAPHLFYDDDEGMWVHLAFHNPDHLEVIDSPFAFVRSPPIVRYQPDDRLRQVLSLASTSPQIAAIRESIPDELVAAIMGRQHIELSPVNFTFIPRKLFPYDVRGTSILSRLWRTLMYEDAIAAAAIAVARRSAAPLKIAKLGDAASMWVPTPEQMQQFLEMAVQAEVDPASWLVWNFGVQVELVGSQERAWKLEASSEYIDKQKLGGLGIGKGFIFGETSYASTAGQLTTFLRDLACTREFFEKTWLIPKFFRQLAEMNEWYLPTPAEVAHHVRVRRSRREAAERLIVPTLEWEQPLDPSIDGSLVSAMQGLEQLGIRFSDATKTAVVNRDWEKEFRQSIVEAELKAKLLTELAQRNPMAAQLLSQALGGGGGPGGGGGGGLGGILPGLPPEAMGAPPGGLPGGPNPDMAPPLDAGAPGAEAPPPGGVPGAAGAGLHADVGGAPGAPGAGAGGGGASGLWRDDKYGTWSRPVVEELVELLHGEPGVQKSLDEPWRDVLGLDPKRDGDLPRIPDPIEAVTDALLSHGYSPADVASLRTLLKAYGFSS